MASLEGEVNLIMRESQFWVTDRRETKGREKRL